MSFDLKAHMSRQEEIRQELWESDSDPHMWNYWVEDKGFEDALVSYYPGTLKYDDEIKTLFYIWRTTEQKSLKERINEIMEERSDAWKEKYGEEMGFW